MKKSSLITKASSRRTSRDKNLLLIGVLFIALIGVFMLVPRLISGVASVVVAPFDAATNWIRHADGTLPTYLRTRHELNQTIASLEQTIAEKSNNNLTLAKLQRENAHLLTLLGNSTEERVIASVVSRPPELPYDLLMVDEGTAKGIVPGAPVYLGHDQLIGVVSHATEHTAYIELITTPGFASTVFIYGPDIFTKAEGYGGGVLRVHVPQGIDLAVGNIVIVPAVDSAIYGTISHIQTSPTQPEQYGFVVPTVPLQSIHKVAIGSKAIAEPDFDVIRTIVENNRPQALTLDIPDDLLITPTSTATSTATTTEEADE